MKKLMSFAVGIVVPAFILAGGMANSAMAQEKARAASPASQAVAQKFQFAAIGDSGYSKKSEQEFSRMVAAMNKEDLAFVVHVGDCEADPRSYERSPNTISMPCTDESFRKVLAQFQESSHPFILTPGDNDWTDCHLLKAQKVDPLDRLAKVREMFYPDGRSLGRRTIAVESQAKDPKFGKFRALAVGTRKRMSLLPDVPTLAEAGIPGIQIES